MKEIRCPNCDKLVTNLDQVETNIETIAYRWDFNKKQYIKRGVSKSGTKETWLYCKRCNAKTII